MKKIKFNHMDKNIVAFLKLHLNEGWSTSSFIGRLTSGYKGLRYLKENNQEFKELYERSIIKNEKERRGERIW